MVTLGNDKESNLLLFKSSLSLFSANKCKELSGISLTLRLFIFLDSKIAKSSFVALPVRTLFKIENDAKDEKNLTCHF